MSFLQGGEERIKELTSLQTNQDNVRNICILAHVDHGKTTLSDLLIASNGIISRRQAGKLRYMDNREDEQLRGITMKSSAIALKFVEGSEKYLINLIDSPGHVDFSSEVSTAVRLCDGALVVVDVVEGVCPQTKVVLEQAWLEGIKPCLVLNKMDRLITHLKITPLEAYGRIEHILQQVNAVTASLWTTEIMQQNQEKGDDGDKTSENPPASTEDDEEVVYNWDSGIGEADDSNVYFSPEQGNVVFASAIDGWGFGIEHFVQLYTKKLGFKEDVLRKTLWGDFYINSKTKRICKGARDKGKKPLFVQFVLENIWTVYDAVLVKKNKPLIDKITSSLGLKISARDSTHSDPFIHLTAICSQWLPLSAAVLGMVIRVLPCPRGLSRERLEKLMCAGNRKIDSYPIETQELVDSFISCSPEPHVPVIVFISKMFLADLSSVHETQTRKLTLEELKEKREALIRNLRSGNTKPVEANEDSNEDNIEEKAKPEPAALPHQFLAFSRVFSGTLRKGQKLFVLQPRYDPTLTSKPLLQTTPTQEYVTLPPHVTTVTITELYLMMGRDLLEVESVAPGNVAGIGGLGDSVMKSGTLSSSLACTSFRELQSVAFPIVHVALEAVHFSDLPSLDKGLKLLDQSDPCVRCTYQETGERILSTAGEVHLQRCLDDLRNVYAGVELKVSPPIVPFRETVIARPTVDMVNEIISSENELIGQCTESHAPRNNGPVTCSTPGNNPHLIKILATPIPEGVVDILDKSSCLLKILTSMGGASYHGNEEGVVEGLQNLYEELKNKLETADKKKWGGAIDQIWSFGPRNSGTNILLNRNSSYERPSIWRSVVNQEKGVVDQNATGPILRNYDNSIISGFQLASLSGPLCEEPLRGVCFEVLEWTEPTNDDETEQDTLRGPVSGQLISVVKECCRQAMLAQPTRLVAPMYSCIIQAATSVLGFVYAVIGRRGGRVISEEMVEGADLFVIQALIPVAESFGFCDEFRKQTIGQANPQLVFSHWEVLPSDPFWVPSTEMELEHYGEKADTESQARIYMNSVRKRKGLAVDEKIVEHAEKQRTLKRNK